MPDAMKYSILAVTGESIKDGPLADKIIALDRRNMEAILRAVGLEFPERRRRATLHHHSNRLLIAMAGEEVAGYVDYCDDLTNPEDLYLSSIQIEAAHRGGALFKLLMSRLLAGLRDRPFKRIRTQIQKSNERAVSMARRAGFTLQENRKSPATLDVFAERGLLDSRKLARLFDAK